MANILTKYKNQIPKHCLRELSKEITKVCDYLDEYSPECPICGVSLLDLELSGDNVVLCHNCNF